MRENCDFVVRVNIHTHSDCKCPVFFGGTTHYCVSWLQKQVISTKKQPGCKKKGVALFRMASVKKLQNQSGWPKMAVMV